MDLGLPPMHRMAATAPGGRYIKSFFERSSVRSCIGSVLTFALMGLQRQMTWSDVARSSAVAVLTTFIAIFMGKDSEAPLLTPPSPPSRGGTPPGLMGLMVCFLGLVVIAGCESKPYVPPPGPTPTPVPVPPGPTPVPVPPPAPAGRVLTPAEYDGVVVGTTQETAVLAAYGPPWRRAAIGTPGTSALLYFATDPAGASRIAEFWVRDGLVVNKNRL